MTYSERDGQVVLRMSKEQFSSLREVFRAAIVSRWPDTMWILQLENIINDGNPNWKRYQVPFSSPSPDADSTKGTLND